MIWRRVSYSVLRLILNNHCPPLTGRTLVCSLMKLKDWVGCKYFLKARKVALHFNSIWCMFCQAQRFHGIKCPWIWWFQTKWLSWRKMRNEWRKHQQVLCQTNFIDLSKKENKKLQKLASSLLTNSNFHTLYTISSQVIWMLKVSNTVTKNYSISYIWKRSHIWVWLF